MVQGGNKIKPKKVEKTVKKNKQKKDKTNVVLKKTLTSKVATTIEKDMLDKIRKDGKILRLIGKSEPKKEEKISKKKTTPKKKK